MMSQGNDEKEAIPVSNISVQLSCSNEVARQGFEGPTPGCRRFGAAFRHSDEVIGYHGGIGSQSNRADSLDVYNVASSSTDSLQDVASPTGRLMCHSITSIGNGNPLKVGGRT